MRKRKHVGEDQGNKGKEKGFRQIFDPGKHVTPVKMVGTLPKYLLYFSRAIALVDILMGNQSLSAIDWLQRDLPRQQLVLHEIYVFHEPLFILLNGSRNK